MAIDEALLDDADRTGSRLLRLYRWDPPTLSLGRNQPLEGIAPDGIPVVRRPTGGQAVWHEHEVTYAVAAPISAFGSLRRAYQAIHERIAAGLRLLGADVSLATACGPVGPSARPVSCFAAPAGGEILARGRKLVGSAQVRRRRALLQHGSILLGGSQGITLSEVLGRRVAFDEVAHAIIGTWGEPLRPLRRPAVGPSALASAGAR